MIIRIIFSDCHSNRLCYRQLVEPWMSYSTVDFEIQNLSKIVGAIEAEYT